MAETDVVEAPHVLGDRNGRPVRDRGIHQLIYTLVENNNFQCWDDFILLVVCSLSLAFLKHKILLGNMFAAPIAHEQLYQSPGDRYTIRNITKT